MIQNNKKKGSKMNVNFSVFIDKILSGEKRQTIRRASPKWKNVKVGDKLTLYTGLRTKQCRKLGEAVVESITPIMIDTECDNVAVETPLGDFNLDLPALNDLVARDGFDSNDEFFKFFCLNYKVGRFKMFVIRWTDFKEAKDER